MPLIASLTMALMAANGTLPLDFDLPRDGAQPVVADAGADHGFEKGSTPRDQRFFTKLPEGTYRVTLRIGSNTAPAQTTVKAEARRLMLRNIATRKGESVERRFLVEVRRTDLAPSPADAPAAKAVQIDARDRAEATWDDRLTLEFSGSPAVTHVRIEPVRAPKVYLVGDSTVADQYAEPYASWGQMLPAMVDDTVVVANHAKSGATLKSFLLSSRLAKVLEGIQPDDWLFIQFAHNDQKAQWPQTFVDPDHTYQAYLAAYVAEARRLGARPVIVTSMERRNFDEHGRIKDTLGAYAQAARKVATELNVPLIDLNRDSIAIYEALGPALAPSAFAQNGEDHTHNDNYGAWLMASAVAAGIREKLPELAAHLNAAPFDPHHPPTEAQVAIVPSQALPSSAPAGN